MAAKIRCPNCGRILKEEYDYSKKAQGEYRVYTHEDSKSKKSQLIIKCLRCGHIADTNKWLIE